MSLNCNEINLILEELNIDGYFIQDIIQPGYDTLALYLYANGTAKTLLICTAQNSCRINETRRKIIKNDKPLRFMEFLKSNIKGSKILKCRQIGLQRIIQFDLMHGDEKFIMYVRLWSNAANIIVCDSNNTILDSMFRRPGKDEVTGGKFILPPENPKAAEKVFPVRDFEEIAEEYARKNPDYPNLSFNQKVDLWYGEHADSLSKKALLEQAEKWYTSKKSRMTSALEKLKAKQKDFANSERLKHQGDLILTYAHLLTKDSKFLECEDYETNSSVRILIDPEKSAHENAAIYYENYKKAQSGAESLVHDIEVAEKKLEKLEKMYSEICAEQNPVRIEQLLRKDSTPKQQQKKEHPGLDYTVDGWYILVGRDANENDELLRHHVKGFDMWLHVRDFPGGYVFIKNRPGKTVPLEILLDAANLAVYYSKARNAGKTDLYYTQVKYLRRAKNGPKGLVLPTHEKNLCITPDKKRLERLDSIKQEAEL
ncbi:MAG: NFACT family protein [Treponema sp.]|nr:NFACT family protein [Treponema sp.]